MELEIIKLDAIGIGNVYQVNRFVFDTLKDAKQFVAKYQGR